ncbi:MAG: hypothetical protein O6946_00060, partial [Gammaproteobacteria bacterium]|nr:hypothetical protein [Gammaproteobacteria bacterium]
MRRWGLLVSAVYLLLLYLLFMPLWSILGADSVTWIVRFEDIDWDWGSLDSLLVIGWFILPILGLLLAQVVLFVSVDRSFRRPIPRSSLRRTVWATAFATGLLTTGALISVAFAIDTAWNSALVDSEFEVALLMLSWIPAWIIWGLALIRYVKVDESLVHLMISRLLDGSVMELLVAVPCHVYIRYKEECSAPLFSGWGIVTGIAVMLLALGPGVLLLYRKRLQQ